MLPAAVSVGQRNFTRPGDPSSTMVAYNDLGQARGSGGGPVHPGTRHTSAAAVFDIGDATTRVGAAAIDRWLPPVVHKEVPSSRLLDRRGAACANRKTFFP
jgi:hypothetical protein